ncbi:MAG: hypothetical protein WA937_14380 [Flavobacteriales bacterium]
MPTLVGNEARTGGKYIRASRCTAFGLSTVLEGYPQDSLERMERLPDEDMR